LYLALHHLVLDRLRQLHNFDRAALIVAAANEALLLQRGDVLVHRRERRQLQALADFFKARRVSMLGLKCDEVIENLFCLLVRGMFTPPLTNLFHRQFRRKESERQASFFLRLLSSLPSAVSLKVIYRLSMDYSPNRSASVTAAAIVAILSGLFFLLCCSFAFFAFLMVKLPGTTSEVPPLCETLCWLPKVL